MRFCDFLLRASLDQVHFMQPTLHPANLLRRIELYCRDESEAGRLPRGACAVLREALLQGAVERGAVPGLVGLRERAARNITSTEAVERWFPSLYPAAPTF